MANTSVGLDAATTAMPSTQVDDHDVVVTGCCLGEQVRDAVVQIAVLEVDELETHLVGHAPHEVGLGDQARGSQKPRDRRPDEFVIPENRLHVFDARPVRPRSAPGPVGGTRQARCRRDSRAASPLDARTRLRLFDEIGSRGDLIVLRQRGQWYRGSMVAASPPVRAARSRGGVALRRLVRAG